MAGTVISGTRRDRARSERAIKRGSLVRFGAAGVPVDHGRYVVVATSSDGLVDQAGGKMKCRSGVGENGADLRVRDFVPQPIGAQEQGVAALERYADVLGYSGGKAADRLVDLVAGGMVARVILGNETSLQQAAHRRVIVGEAIEPARVAVIGAHVTDVSDGYRIVADQRDDESGAHAGALRVRVRVLAHRRVRVRKGMVEQRCRIRLLNSR